MSPSLCAHARPPLPDALLAFMYRLLALPHRCRRMSVTDLVGAAPGGCRGAGIIAVLSEPALHTVEPEGQASGAGVRDRWRAVSTNLSAVGSAEDARTMWARSHWCAPFALSECLVGILAGFTTVLASCLQSLHAGSAFSWLEAESWSAGIHGAAPAHLMGCYCLRCRFPSLGNTPY